MSPLPVTRGGHLSAIGVSKQTYTATVITVILALRCLRPSVEWLSSIIGWVRRKLDLAKLEARLKYDAAADSIWSDSLNMDVSDPEGEATDLRPYKERVCDEAIPPCGRISLQRSVFW